MPFLSVIVPTMRVGGIDILLDSLKAQTFTDFELVLVDAIGDRRRAEVEREAKDRFVCVRHAVPEPSPFPVASYCLMANSGIMASTGEVLLFAVDYSWFPPGLLEAHAKFHRADATKRAGLMGPHRHTQLKVDPRFPAYGREEVDRYEADLHGGALDQWMISVGTPTGEVAEAYEADGGSTVRWDSDPKLHMQAGPIASEYFHSRNESVRREHVLEVCGFDQDLDGTHLYQDSDFADRLSVKAGVQWVLDPALVLDIANPRRVFPYARRERHFSDNERIWRSKQAAGYPNKPNSILDGARCTLVERQTANPLRVGLVYGEFGSYSSKFGKFNAKDLFVSRGMTGSELSFFNLARTLAEEAHRVTVFCDTGNAPRQVHRSGFELLPLSAMTAAREQPWDVFFALNEPDYLRYAPAGAVRVFDQLLNDFAYTESQWYKDCGTWLGEQPRDGTPWGQHVDVYAAPSQETLDWHRAEGGVGSRYAMRDDALYRVVPNSCNLDFFATKVTRHPHRAIWASSPDRGLHVLLSMWPEIRQQVPDAELRIFYDVKDALGRLVGATDENGRRARYMASALPRLARLGVTAHESFLYNAAMAREYQAAAVYPYTFEPTRHTETLPCAVLDSCAAGCWPILSDADCLPSVFNETATIVPGKPSANAALWVSEIVKRMKGGVTDDERAAMARTAREHDRRAVAKRWLAVFREAIAMKGQAS